MQQAKLAEPDDGGDGWGTGDDDYGDLRLRPLSPAIDAGFNVAVVFDLDGNPRIVDGNADDDVVDADFEEVKEEEGKK